MNRMTRPARHVTGVVDTPADVHIAVVVDSATGHVAGTASLDTTTGPTRSYGPGCAGPSARRAGCAASLTPRC